MSHRIDERACVYAPAYGENKAAVRDPLIPSTSISHTLPPPCPDSPVFHHTTKLLNRLDLSQPRLIHTLALNFERGLSSRICLIRLSRARRRRLTMVLNHGLQASWASNQLKIFVPQLFYHRDPGFNCVFVFRLNVHNPWTTAGTEKYEAVVGVCGPFESRDLFARGYVVRADKGVEEHFPLSM